MKVILNYDKEKDIRCLLKYGRSSTNCPLSTKVYKKLVNKYGENPTNKEVSLFLEKYISENNIDIQKTIENYQKDWDIISSDYQKRAEKLFGVSLQKDVTVYLTVNDRRPYDIENNIFYVSLPPYSTIMKKTVMHELWHFYTWYKFGLTWEDKLGKEKYNELKETLTVLLNVECKDLLPEGIEDIGYPQHKKLREKIIHLWDETKDIEKLWNILVSI